eukprot:9474168-Pyramimonas_sp.AAC.1
MVLWQGLGLPGRDSHFIRGVDIPGLPGRSIDVDSRRCSPRNGALARLEIFKPLSSNGALPA